MSRSGKNFIIVSRARGMDFKKALVVGGCLLDLLFG